MHILIREKDREYHLTLIDFNPINKQMTKKLASFSWYDWRTRGTNKRPVNKK